MKRSLSKLVYAVVFALLASTTAFADVEMKASDQTTQKALQDPSFNPLSQERLSQFGELNRSYELRSRYGLIDRDDQFTYFNNVDSQRDSLITEVLARQADNRLKAFKTQIQAEAPHSIAAQSTLLLGAAYLIYNGKPISTHLSPDTEFSARAHAADRTGSVTLKRTHLSPFNLVSGIDYQLDATQTACVTASVSKEITPHVVASVNQRRSLAGATSTIIENTGQINFGMSF
jgi:hypothetical protein